MGKPYSTDLRERVVAAVLEGRLSRNKAAAQFAVAVSTVVIWVQRYQETGGVAPGQMGGHKPKAIRGAHGAFLRQRVREGAFTLRGLVRELADSGLKVDYRSVWNFVHAEKLSFKKNRRGQRARPARRRAPTGAVGSIRRRRRVSPQQVGEQREVGNGIEAVHELTGSATHIEARVDVAGRGHIGLAVPAQRREGASVLQGVHGSVIVGRSGRIDASQDPNQACGAFQFADAGRKGAARARSGDHISLRRRASRPCSRRGKDVCPGVHHGKQRVTACRSGRLRIQGSSPTSSQAEV